jgi:Zn-finger nucleic acid-binding protein
MLCCPNAGMGIFKMKAWLDVALLRCPKCGHYYVDASWYVVEMESDIECGHCRIEFNSKKNATDRAMLEFQLDENGKMQKVKIVKHFDLE